MQTIHRPRTHFLALAAVLGVALYGPPAVTAEENVLALVPATTGSWDESSGYGSVEANRLAAATGTSWDETSGYGSVEVVRAERLAQFRAVERSLSRSLGAETPEIPSCDVLS